MDFFGVKWRGEGEGRRKEGRFYIFICCAQSCLILCNTMNCSCPRDFPFNNIGVSCHVLLQRVFPTREQIHLSCISCIGGLPLTRLLTYRQQHLGNPIFICEAKYKYMYAHCERQNGCPKTSMSKSQEPVILLA